MKAGNLEEREDAVLYKPPSTRNTVLLIDDDEDHRALFETLLANEGMNIYGACSAQDAFELISYQHFDLIICDLRMPEINGLDFVQSIRNSPQLRINSDIPIIMLTAGGADLELAALEVGADMFCQKRAAHSLLISQVKFLLD